MRRPKAGRDSPPSLPACLPRGLRGALGRLSPGGARGGARRCGGAGLPCPALPCPCRGRPASCAAPTVAGRGGWALNWKALTAPWQRDAAPLRPSVIARFPIGRRAAALPWQLGGARLHRAAPLARAPPGSPNQAAAARW